MGEAFTMLTGEPAPNVASYHNRSIVVLAPEQCERWPDSATAERDGPKPLAAGNLEVERVN